MNPKHNNKSILLYQKLMEQLYISLPCIITSSIVTLYLSEIFHITMSKLIPIGFCIVTYIVILLVDRYKKQPMCYMVLGIVIMLGFIISRVFKFRYVDLIKSVYHWMISYYGDEKDFVLLYSLLLCALGVLAISLVSYLIHKIKWMKVLFSIIYISMCIYNEFSGRNQSKLLLVLIMLYLFPVIISIFAMDIRVKRNRLKLTITNSKTTMWHHQKNIIPYIFIVFFTISLISVTLPSKDEPLQFNMIKTMFNQFESAIDYIKDRLSYINNPIGEEFNYTTGYLEKEVTTIGGKNGRNSEVALEIKTYRRTRTNGYILGSIYDRYTGKGFTKSERESNVVSDSSASVYDTIDFFNTVARVWKKEDAVGSLIERKVFDITYKGIRTRTKFQMGKEFILSDIDKSINIDTSTNVDTSTNDTSGNKKYKLDRTIQGNVRYKKSKGYGFRYELDFLDINLQHPVIVELLRNDTRERQLVTKEQWQGFHWSMIKDKGMLPYELLLEALPQVVEREKEIRDTYTQLPQTVTSRTKELAREITKNYDNDYDKLKAIESYLNTYEYSFDVGDTKDVPDVVDYFLFELKKGYCTFYASAMVVLARSIDIPIRYVEGYVIDYSKDITEYKVTKDETYEVYSDNAHAWVEAYFTGVGWIPFEPTKGYTDGRYSGWINYTNSNITISEEEIQYYQSKQKEEDMSPPSESQDKSNEVVKEEKGLQLVIRVGIVLVFVLLITVSTFVAYYFYMKYAYRKRYNNATLNKKLIIIMNEILECIYLDGNRNLGNETLLQYRCDKSLNIWKPDQFHMAVDYFMEVRYGDKNVEESRLLDMVLYRNHYEEQLKEKIGRIKRSIRRFFFIISKSRMV